MIRAVYDTMVFFQWATLPPAISDRRHATLTAIVRGSVRLCLSADLVFEVQNVLSRPELREKYKSLTPEQVAAILGQARQFADWFDAVRRRFTYVGHEKDDHVLNLAIESRSRYLVTREKRLPRLGTDNSRVAESYRALAPGLAIVSPAEVAALLNVQGI